MQTETHSIMDSDIFDRYEKAAISRAFKKLRLGNHNLTKYERVCYDIYRDLGDLFLPVPWDTEFENDEN